MVISFFLFTFAPLERAKDCCCSSVVEHFLGKEEVTSSSLVNSSRIGRLLVCNRLFLSFRDGRAAAPAAPRAPPDRILRWAAKKSIPCRSTDYTESTFYIISQSSACGPAGLANPTTRPTRPTSPTRLTQLTQPRLTQPRLTQPRLTQPRPAAPAGGPIAYTPREEAAWRRSGCRRMPRPRPPCDAPRLSACP